ncbi:MAG: hypothetical protein ACR2L2_18500 [Acidobacteriota bacterium]
MLLVAGYPSQGLLSAQPAPSASEQVMAVMVAINAQLEASGADFRVEKAEYLTLDTSAEMGRTVFFTDRGNKQLDAHFVPGDPRRGGRTNISYIVDQAEGAIDGLTTPQTTAAIDRAMATWQGVNCSDIPITKQPDFPGLDLGVVEFFHGLGGLPFPLADITHAGWLPAGISALILPPNVIAATFTFVFVGGGGPTDIDQNGKADVAFSEILYNDNFLWRINGDVDVETVALHEAGHGLSQAHFGALFQTGANGKFHFAPKAVMNAGYTGVQQELKGTDNGGHCSIWASWPNN